MRENEVIKLHARPRPPLDRFVECFRFYRGYVRDHDREIVLPTGASSVVFKLADTPVRSFRDTGDTVGQTFGGAVASGAFASHFVLDTSQTSSTLGVQFKPGCASAFFGAPAGELSGTRVSLEDLWGPKALSLRDQILEAATPEAAIARARANRCRARHRENRRDPARDGVRSKAIHRAVSRRSRTDRVSTRRARPPQPRRRRGGKIRSRP